MEVIIGCLACVPGQEKDADPNMYLVDNNGNNLLDNENVFLTCGEELIP